MAKVLPEDGIAVDRRQGIVLIHHRWRRVGDDSALRAGGIGGDIGGHVGESQVVIR